MAALNRVLIILIAIMSIAAAFLSFRLFERRTDFRNRAADLAETVKSVVDNLDDRSNTRVQKYISFAPANPVEKQPESGTLSWEEYANPAEYEARLDRVEKLAADINKQRNYLAEQLRQVALDLGIPVEELTVDDLTNAADAEIYRDSAQKVVRLATAVAERSNAMIQTVITTAQLEHVEAPVSEADLTERIVTTDEDGNDIYGSFKYREPLETYQTAVNDLNTKYADYKNTLAGAITQISAFDWNTTASRVNNPGSNYSPALTTLANDFNRINELLIERDTLEAKVATLEDIVDKLKSELDEVNDDRTRLRAKVDDLQKTVADYKLRLSEAGAAGVADKLDPDLKGQVVMVNRQWDFVILNLGKGKVFRNSELLIARGEKYIARVLVTNVAKNISVADIIGQTQQTEIQKNDTVLAPGRQAKSLEENL